MPPDSRGGHSRPLLPKAWDALLRLVGIAIGICSDRAEPAVATTEAPPLGSLLHQMHNGMRVIEDRSRCQLTLPDGPHLRVETILRLPEVRRRS